jgi:hypothetical protein
MTEIERLQHDIDRYIAIAGELATENERLRTDRATVYAWMREPEDVERADLDWLIEWLNRRPWRAAHSAGQRG